MHNNGQSIQVYCDSIDRSSEGNKFTVKNLNDPRITSVLEKEGISLNELKNLKLKLDQFKCNSFFSFEDNNIYTGKADIHIEFGYNEWNGINFYYYKLFDKKIDPNSISFFKTHLDNKNQGAVMDTNAI